MQKERSVCAGLRQAMVAMETNRPHSRLFPDALIVLWLMRPSGEALSLYLWKPSKWAHYDESRSKREWLHTFPSIITSTFCPCYYPKTKKKKPPMPQREMAGGHRGMTVRARWSKNGSKKFSQLSTIVNS